MPNNISQEDRARNLQSKTVYANLLMQKDAFKNGEIIQINYNLSKPNYSGTNDCMILFRDSFTFLCESFSFICFTEFSSSSIHIHCSCSCARLI